MNTHIFTCKLFELFNSAGAAWLNGFESEWRHRPALDDVRVEIAGGDEIYCFFDQDVSVDHGVVEEAVDVDGNVHELSFFVTRPIESHDLIRSE